MGHRPVLATLRFSTHKNSLEFLTHWPVKSDLFFNAKLVETKYGSVSKQGYSEFHSGWLVVDYLIILNKTQLIWMRFPQGVFSSGAVSYLHVCCCIDRGMEMVCVGCGWILLWQFLWGSKLSIFMPHKNPIHGSKWCHGSIREKSKGAEVWRWKRSQRGTAKFKLIEHAFTSELSWVTNNRVTCISIDMLCH